MLENQLLGAWICPDGSIHWTCNINSHRQVINELGINDTLKCASSQMKWTSDDILQHRNLDLAEVAMRLGYIRVTAFANQLGIETGIKREHLTCSQLNALSQVYWNLFLKNRNETGEILQTTIFETFQRNDYEMFDSFYDFMSSTNDLVSKSKNDDKSSNRS